MINLDQQRRGFLAPGWWFNELVLTLLPGENGNITVPAKTIDVYGLDGNSYVVREKNQLYDLKRGTFVFVNTVRIRAIQDVFMEDLPESVAQYIAYQTAADIYANDMGYDENTRYLQFRAAKALENVHTQEVRHRNYNSRNLNMYKRVISKLRT
jgi:hypothetical protein